MKWDIVLTAEIDLQLRKHLLGFFDQGVKQEHLCFGIWYPSHGTNRHTAVIRSLVLPLRDDVQLHGNASFEGKYLSRAVREAKQACGGLAMMHSHPFSGWQDMSNTDIIAERDIVAYQAQVTKQPLVGMTIGSDGYWSARMWRPESKQMKLVWCDKVRVPRKNRYQIYWNPSVLKDFEPTSMLRRTIETWGVGVQRGVQNLHVGIVGLGSVGSIVAEALARIGISEITLVDHDRIEIHNLDRHVFAERQHIGQLKVEFVKRLLELHSTSNNLQVHSFPYGIEYEEAFNATLDCDLLLCCVDRPLARDVLNFVAICHCIPVIDAGIAVEVNGLDRSFESARWRTHLIIPGFACLRCTGQYTSSDVVAELDGSLDDPNYIQNLPLEHQPQNQNVFPFALGCASMQANLMIRYILAKDWWPTVHRQEYRYIGAQTSRTISECQQNCIFKQRIGLGSEAKPHYLRQVSPNA